MQAPLLTTERLSIEPVSLDHWEEHAAMWGNPELTAFIGGGKPRPRDESWRRFIGAPGLWHLLGYGYWSFLDKETGVYLGTGGLANFERGVAELEGYPEAGWAFAPSAWNKGYATEAMQVILSWADAHLDVKEIRCIIDHANKASIRVAEKLGFTYLCDNEDVLGPVQVYRREAVKETKERFNI
ncbi:GNAT family N-acetyltransferase [Sphingorhabdus sp. Alg239-R122]|uniref:GNAT family N-acetyltransferase n=1 Tax=Sphingorhabdus sp. Alg239-R122 TaxID=2305989 RepID=UPI0013D9270A|nr:GNAT family N-acetyltransferase [Sphingorhabdus sp. Alg239-R122]